MFGGTIPRRIRTASTYVSAFRISRSLKISPQNDTEIYSSSPYLLVPQKEFSYKTQIKSFNCAFHIDLKVKQRAGIHASEFIPASKDNGDHSMSGAFIATNLRPKSRLWSVCFERTILRDEARGWIARLHCCSLEDTEKRRGVR
ncbi:hypothetical protein BDN70DRAFT_885466 [Pholiota conissans]|uniref:Uncharacterized protein n=1 Tax=Pholiota conissans TaxID=109636 RepID=A0A9P6CPE1_9AGAR|nr:hypothetical protein BDN70DRAFT_885466 [Pholiota conissans]